MFELAAAHSVAKFMGCMCFGLALMTSLLVIRALCIVPFSSFSHACWALLVICIATTLIGAISVAQMLRHMLNTFVYYSNSGGVTAEPYDIKDPTNILHAITYPIQCFLGDLFLVYRTWVVYGRSYKMIITPALLLAVNPAIRFAITAAELRLKSGTVSDPTVIPWTTPFFAPTVFQNVVCTALIIGRIWRVSSATPGARVAGRRVDHFVQIIVEAGVIYTATSCLSLHGMPPSIPLPARISRSLPPAST